MTKKLSSRIEFALRHAVRAHEYIMRPDHAVCVRRTAATTTLDYTRPDGSVLYEVAREYGSDLTGLESCIAELRSILAVQS
jgi:hypothetical protein